MKIWAISLALLLLLTGCDAKSEIERGMALRSMLLKAESCSFEAEVTADYPENTYSFSMDCLFDSEGKMMFEVTAPTTISGITGTVSQSESALTFDEKALYISPMADGQFSPVSAPWILMKTLRSGYLTSACMDDELLRLSIDDSYEENALHLDIWLNSQNVPVCCEILYDGRQILSVSVGNFRIL